MKAWLATFFLLLLRDPMSWYRRRRDQANRWLDRAEAEAKRKTGAAPDLAAPADADSATPRRENPYGTKA